MLVVIISLDFLQVKMRCFIANYSPLYGEGKRGVGGGERWKVKGEGEGSKLKPSLS